MDCSICNKNISVDDSIYHCPYCFEIFHLKCAKNYAQDQIMRKKANASDDNDEQNDNNLNSWLCIHCQKSITEIPYVYFCFCGKQKNPEYDPWIAAHSCGNICGRKFPCGHACNALCHPGPCTPCARTSDVFCFCGRHHTIKRCGASSYSCGEICGKLLSCKTHRCSQICHEGPCPDCHKTRECLCNCGRHKGLLSCDQSSWSCGEICNKPLSCGHHQCQFICHSGECPPCPLLPPRKCFCGKKIFDIPCNIPTPSCGQICGKILSCGVPSHTCSFTCHNGECAPCTEMVTVRCRCGRCEGSVRCGTQFVCNTRCNHPYPCGKHVCKKRCCTSNHQKCEELCGKKLDCGIHTCPLTCHPGPCPSCSVTVTLRCNCGKSTKIVSCRERTIASPPECTEYCTKKSKCHHDHIQPHYCHYGPCPPCSLPCHKLLPCGHLCLSLCHDNSCNKTCPPCTTLVSVECVGHHKTLQVPCYQSNSSIHCDEKCGHLLACGIHHCTLPCHPLLSDPDGIPCEVCHQPCSRDRSCKHPCSIGRCHFGSCPDCQIPVNEACYCGKSQKQVLCKDIQQSHGFSCGNICHKPLRYCSHFCCQKCHSGDCNIIQTMLKDTENNSFSVSSGIPVDIYSCKDNVKVVCPCGKKKETWSCIDIHRKELLKMNKSVITNKYKCIGDKYIGLTCDDSCISSQKQLSPNTKVTKENNTIINNKLKEEVQPSIQKSDSKVYL
ncbi:hypothetical protein WA158_004963 [Blastocystis sp. Blastoise]